MSEKELEVQQVLNTLRPAMEADGGGVDLVSVQEEVVKLRFKGTCLVCPSINLTFRLGIVKSLQEKLPWIKSVVKL
jgi:Fe-S cluster biogenesis protein NfuA